MVTFEQLHDFDPKSFQELADDWGRMWRRRLEERSDDVHEYADRLRGHWEGEAADAAFGRLKRIRTELDATKAPLTTVETVLSGAGDTIGRAKGMLEDALDAAKRIPAKVVANGEEIEVIYTGDGELDKERRIALGRSMTDILDAIEDALGMAAKADKSAADALQDLVPGYDPDSQAGGYVSLSDVPEPGTDPSKVNQWWDSLSPAEQQYLIHNHPERIGGLDGVPVIYRDQANKVTLERERVRNETRKRKLLDRKRELLDKRESAHLYDREKIERELRSINEELGIVNNNLAGIEALEKRLYEPQKGQPKAYLLGFEPGRPGDQDGDGMADDDGRVIVAVGNPDTADNVATYVPGMGTDIANMDKDIGRADDMAADAHRADDTENTAVIMWLDYDAPDDLSAAGTDDYARDATDNLRRFQDGLRATHEGPKSHNTVIGHSYGSLVVGHTASEDVTGDGRPDGIAADEVVFVGSPGVGVDHAADLGMDPDHVWATRAKHDAIRAVPDWGGHGQDPSFPEFGGRRFESDPGDPDNEKAAHSGYWEPDNKARENLAEIITGQPEKVNKYEWD